MAGPKKRAHVVPVEPAQAAQNNDESANPDKRKEKAQMILRAAAKMFNEQGFHGTSVADVAQALGMSKPFLYYYVKDKNQMLIECSRLATETLHGKLEEIRKARVTNWERLVMIFKAYAQVITTDFGVCLIRNAVPGALPDSIREKLSVGRRRLNREVEQVIARGIADGSIRPCDPIMLSFTLFGAFNWMTYWYHEDGPFTPDEIAEQLLDIFAKGVQAGARSSDAGQ